MDKIRWIICDDSPSVCKSFELGLKCYDDLIYEGCVYSAGECIEFLKEKKPDILLLDISMETETAGIDYLSKFKEVSSQTKIIILTSSSYSNKEYIFFAFAKGADNYLSKTTSDDEIVQTMRDVYNEKSALQSQVGKVLAEKSSEILSDTRSTLYMLEIMTRLSPSEFEVLKEIYKGKSYDEIAEKRFVDVGTVKTQAHRILKKFNVSNMKELKRIISEVDLFKFFR